MNKRIFILIPLLFLSSYLYSQDTATLKVLPAYHHIAHIKNPLSVTTLDDAVITGTKYAVSSRQLPFNVSIIRETVIENSAESSVLPVLGNHVPGLFVTERGVAGYGVSNGAAGSVSIRGIGGNRVLMLFDGQPQWAGVFGHSLPDTYLSSDIDRIEVIRGPASLLYGSNAMGGVVNMITRMPDETSVGGRIMYGSYNTQKYMIRASAKENKISGIISFNHDRTDGHRENSDFKLYNGFAKLTYEHNEYWTVSADILLADYMAMNPGEESNPMIDYRTDVMRGTASVQINNKYTKYSNTEGSIRLFYNFGNHKVNDGWKNGAPRDYRFYSHDYNRGAVVYQMFRFNTGMHLTVGVDYKQWGGKAWNRYIGNRIQNLVDKDVNEFAGYALVQQNFNVTDLSTVIKRFLNKLTINAGVRWEHNETYGNEFIPQAGFAYRYNSTTTLKASVSKGFRSPNIRELYMFDPANPDLKPEQNMNYDISLQKYLFSGRLNLELAAFFIKGDNIIQTIRVNGKPLNINTDDFINKGIEFSAAYNLNKYLNVYANYSYLYMHNPMLASPQNQLNIQLSGNIKKLSYTLGARYISGLYLTLGSNAVKEDYLLFNAQVAYRVGSIAKLFIKSENISDRKYYINYGFPMPGITVFGGIDFKI